MTLQTSFFLYYFSSHFYYFLSISKSQFFYEALNDNKTYRVVWQVLQALRSHDDRFDAMINKMELVGPDKSKMEVVAVTDKIGKKKDTSSKANKNTGKGSKTIGTEKQKVDPNANQQTLEFEIGEIEVAIYAKVVQKCGNRHHWEDWANDIAKIANTHITRIKTILEDKQNQKEIQLYRPFVKSWLYFNEDFNARTYQNKKFFPTVLLKI